MTRLRERPHASSNHGPQEVHRKTRENGQNQVKEAREQTTKEANARPAATRRIRTNEAKRRTSTKHIAQIAPRRSPVRVRLAPLERLRQKRSQRSVGTASSTVIAARPSFGRR